MKVYQLTKTQAGPILAALKALPASATVAGQQTAPVVADVEAPHEPVIIIVD